jgi:hypothetical protein
MDENKAVDVTQQVETNAYVPTYRVLPKFKQELMRIVGKYPYNQIAGIMGAINVEVMDHNTLTQIINVLGNFPFEQIQPFLDHINEYVEQVIEE